VTILSLSPGNALGELNSILLLGAHCDDIEIGCGGSILRLASEYPGATVHWVVFSADDTREREARESAIAFLGGLTDRDVRVHRFRDSYFPYVGAEIKDCFRALRAEVDPDLIFTHYRHDLHQDHRTISELTWGTFRDHLILEYEIPKYDGDLGSPNLFVKLPEALCRQKARLLVDAFESQRHKRWFSEDTFLSMMRLRGIESNAESGYAEAYYCRKAVL
jgi:LmbE family N-acetylglucosaminyl deacetylase